MDEKKSTDAVNTSAATEGQRPINEKPVDTIPHNDVSSKRNADVVKTNVEDDATNAINAANNHPTAFLPIKPLQQANIVLPPFPTECLPTVVQNQVNAVASHSQTSPDMAAVIGLGTLAVCAQRKFEVEALPGYTEQLSLFISPIASPGERKSSVMRKMTSPIYDYEQEINKRLEPEIRKNKALRNSLERRIKNLERKLEQKYDQQIEKELEELQAELDNTPQIKALRFTTDDCSSEKLVKLLAENGGRFAVISTEGEIFDNMAGRYSGTANFDVMLKGHCGDQICVDRIGRETERIDHPALSMILSIQPKVLDEIMGNSDMAGRGLLARFLYAIPLSTIGNRDFETTPIQHEVAEEYRKLVFRLMDIIPEEQPYYLHLSPKALDTVSDFFREHERYLLGEGQEIIDWASKYVGTVLRIAGLIHVAVSDEMSLEIQDTTIEKAIKIGQYFLAHARYAYSMMGTDISIKKARFVFAKLVKNGTNEIKRSDLFQMCRGKFFKKTEDLFSTLDLLESRGYIRIVHPERLAAAGRPQDARVVVNPEAVNLERSR